MQTDGLTEGGRSASGDNGVSLVLVLASFCKKRQFFAAAVLT